MLKPLAGLGALALGGVWWSGAILSPGAVWERKVEEPPAAVAAALENLDLGLIPGTGGGQRLSLPEIRREARPDGYSWSVMSGSDVAVELVAELRPVEGGRATDLRAFVRAGHPRIASPAAQNPALIRHLFVNALDGELAAIGHPDDPALAARREQGAAMMSAIRLTADPLAIATDGMDAYEESLRWKEEERRQHRIGNVEFRPGKPMVDVRR